MYHIRNELTDIEQLLAEISNHLATIAGFFEVVLESWREDDSDDQSQDLVSALKTMASLEDDLRYDVHEVSDEKAD